MLRRISYVHVLLLGLASLAGCSKSESPFVSSDYRLITEIYEPGVIVEEPSKGAPYRLAPSVFSSYGDRGTDVLAPLSLDTQWTGGTGKARAVHDGHLLIEAKKRPVSLRWQGKIDAPSYNQLRFRLRVRDGSALTIRWRPDYEDTFSEGYAVTAAVLADDEWHTYEIDLTHVNDSRWAGTIAELELIPTDAVTDVEIADIRLAFHLPEAPRRVTLGEQTHESLFGDLPPWQFRVPESATFETYVGLAPSIAKAKKPTQVRVELETESGDRIALGNIDAELSPGGFRPLRQSLADYAGQDVTLHVETDPPGQPVWWGNPMVTGPAENDLPPVYLISIDTLRADHLSSYGYDRETSPNLDRFAEDAVLFENAMCQETYTLSSHITMMTGLYPKHHATVPSRALGESRVTLPEYLRTQGYVTAGFAGVSGWMLPTYGFAQGFDLYNIPPARRTIAETQQHVDAWLNAQEDASPFLFFHNFDVHSNNELRGTDTPYGPPDPAFLHFSKGIPRPDDFYPADRDAAWNPFPGLNSRPVSREKREYIAALYDDGIRYVDHQIGEFFKSLKASGRYDKALIIVTADHGESLGEHGNYGHHHVYQPESRVPLFVKFPGNKYAGRRSGHLVQLVDILPTVLDVVGAEPDAPLDGHSLIEVMENDRPSHTYAFTRRRLIESVRDARWKLIVDQESSEDEFYDVLADPAESEDRARAHPEQNTRLAEVHRLFYALDKPGWHFRWVSDHDGRKTELGETALALTSEEPFVEVTRVWGEALEGRPGWRIEQRQMEIDLNRFPRDEIIVRTASNDESSQLAVHSKRPVQVWLGGESPQTLDLLEIRLNAKDPKFAEVPPAEDDRLELPYLQIWYRQPADVGAREQELSDEERAILESIGYAQ